MFYEKRSLCAICYLFENEANTERRGSVAKFKQYHTNWISAIHLDFETVLHLVLSAIPDCLSGCQLKPKWNFTSEFGYMKKKRRNNVLLNLDIRRTKWRAWTSSNSSVNEFPRKATIGYWVVFSNISASIGSIKVAICTLFFVVNQYQKKVNIYDLASIIFTIFKL